MPCPPRAHFPALAVVCLAPLLHATDPPPLLTGILIERDTQPDRGEFSVRAPDNQVFRFQFDRETTVERESRSIGVPSLEPGDKVEVASEKLPGSLVRYAHSVQVVVPKLPVRLPANGRLRVSASAADRWIAGVNVPTGNLTFSGVVSRLNVERLVLHLRGTGEQTILLRKDTRYLENGGTVEFGDLKTNMRVFVQAGKDLYDQVEAYQVIWGGILEPPEPPE